MIQIRKKRIKFNCIEYKFKTTFDESKYKWTHFGYFWSDDNKKIVINLENSGNGINLIKKKIYIYPTNCDTEYVIRINCIENKDVYNKSFSYYEKKK